MSWVNTGRICPSCRSRIYESGGKYRCFRCFKHFKVEGTKLVEVDENEET
jgi:hypothetical protein